MYMFISTIRVRDTTKSSLDRYREYRNESYDEVVMKLVGIAENAKKSPKLSREAVKRIAEARKRIKAGSFVTEAEARKRLGL
ncbi:Uncharacterised protein [Candidatus Gugararchaeum adminiculabundum]|nr:Uncharacterised protein [Candidatus Gugararchaeum adminiculabundum]